MIIHLDSRAQTVTKSSASTTAARTWSTYTINDSLQRSTNGWAWKTPCFRGMIITTMMGLLKILRTTSTLTMRWLSMIWRLRKGMPWCQKCSIYHKRLKTMTMRATEIWRAGTCFLMRLKSGSRSNKTYMTFLRRRISWFLMTKML